MPVNIGVNIQRSPNRINQQLREAGVEGKFPKLLLDFKDQYYLASGGSKTLANAVTHARSGNAVMTDGYGPELVTNGGFDSDISGWTEETNGDATHFDGKMRLTVVNSTSKGAYQELTTESGKTYIFTALLVDVDSHSAATVRVGTGGGSGNLFSSTFTEGAIQFSFTATSSTSYITLRPNSTTNGNTAVFDNVSVREMPVLKWAPHNLLRYSQNFVTNWGNTATVAPNAGVAPDGTTTAARVTFLGQYYIISQQNILSVSGSKATVGIWIKRESGNANLALRASTSASHYKQDITVTDDWQLYTAEFTHNGTQDLGFVLQDRNTSGFGSVLVWGAHLYRSDLGGMVDNPDQPPSRASYVPTTSSAVYLPRVGHHVYNGSAWVNEGLLAESESRVNLETYSDILNAQWVKVGATITDDSAVSPAGLEDASLVKEDSTNGLHRVRGNFTPVSGTTYTFSVYAKKKERTIFSIGGAGLYASNEFPEFDVNNGIAYNGGTGNATVNIQDVGNGWFRCSVTFTATGTSLYTVQLHDALVNGAPPSSSGKSYTGDGTSGMYFWGAQTEATSSPPSSLIPTFGSTVTRAAETFTIPSANLPWPEPQYIGDELVTNGTFDTDSDWTKGGDWTISGGVASSSGASGRLNQSTSSVANSNVFIVSLDVVAYTSGTVSVEVGSLNGKNLNVSGTGTYEAVLVSGGSSNIGIYGSSFVGSIDNISVREIDPLSVSIAMDGRMTYADEDITSNVYFYRWNKDGDNSLRAYLDTTSTKTGKVTFRQEANNVVDIVASADTLFSPDILVPYNLVARYGSTFVNGAINGVALTADTTPTALPDLSTTDFPFAYGYMGTMGSVRIWDRDITDDGLVEATNPSLEPSLSLTFEGVGTNSFTVSDWSE